MRKISSHGSKKAVVDEGSILGLTVFILFFFVAAVGLLLRASYAEYKSVCAEYEAFVLECCASGEAGEI
ncbi:MAG: hypothetical protein K5930_12235 [Treponemataceae bacterium]|nr:hypothetical protein [Treponemataceae bacterium]